MPVVSASGRSWKTRGRRVGASAGPDNNEMKLTSCDHPEWRTLQLISVLDGRGVTRVAKGLPVFYILVAALCLAAPYLSAAPAVATALFPYASGPFALVSIALGLGASARRGPLSLELVVAALWGAGAIALSLQLSAPRIVGPPPWAATSKCATSAAARLPCTTRAGTATVVGRRPPHSPEPADCPGISACPPVHWGPRLQTQEIRRGSP